MSGYIGNIPVPQATQTRDVFTATSGQTSFATSGYTPGFLDVWLNGVKLVNGTDFTATNGSDVVLTSGAAASDIVEVLSYSTFGVNSQTFTGSSTFTGDVLIADKLVHDGDTNTTIRFPAADTVTVETAGSERVRVDSSGDVLCGSDGGGDIGSSTKRFKDLYLSGGVYLGGTVAANLLDDYETGTWTPTIKGETTAGTATYLVRWGNYTKVGNLVTVRFYINVNSFTGTGVMRIAGLPFTSGSGSGIHAGSFYPTRVNGNITLTSAGSLSIAVVEGSTEGIFFATSVTSSALSSSINCDASVACQFEGSYFV